MLIYIYEECVSKFHSLSVFCQVVDFFLFAVAGRVDELICCSALVMKLIYLSCKQDERGVKREAG